VVLTDEVSRTLFAEFAAHRGTERGAEETGWVLLGRREGDHAVVLATLPADADRDASEGHVWITGPSHVLASRVVRQHDRRLTTLGVVHTHPGRLRHPSRGDLDGDRVWVRQLRGQCGVFGIGTVTDPAPGVQVAGHPAPNVQTLGGLRFDWYTLAADNRTYQPVPVELTIGPDLAAGLRPVWPVVEEHGERLDRLARQFAAVRFDPTDGPALAVTVGLAEPGESVRVVLEGKTARYFYMAGGEVFQPDLPAGVAPDQGVYLLLAELAARG
jgi:proteasome lid subunit RPN8/RPN11